MNTLRLIHLVVKALDHVPLTAALRIASLIGKIGYWTYRGERELAMRNIQACYPGKRYSWHRQIAIRSFQHIVISAFELSQLANGHPQSRRRILIRNQTRLTEALNNKRGVVLITAHYGNVGVLPLALDGISERPAYIMRAPTRTVGWAVAQFRAYRDKYLKPKSNFASLESSIKGAVTAGHLLKSGNAVIILADVTWGSGTMPVTFLGRPYNISRVPASLSLLTGASLVPIMTFRNGEGRYEVVIEPPIKHPDGLARREAEQKMMEDFGGILERRVKENPEQWFWMHHHSWGDVAN